MAATQQELLERTGLRRRLEHLPVDEHVLRREEDADRAHDRGLAVLLEGLNEPVDQLRDRLVRLGVQQAPLHQAVDAVDHPRRQLAHVGAARPVALAFEIDAHDSVSIGHTNVAANESNWAVLPALDLQGGLALNLYGAWGIALFVGPTVHFGDKLSWGFAGSGAIVWTP